jgi:hypothetical protein
MNVARSTQLELLLITKTLDIITTTPGLSVAKFFEEFIEAVNQLPDSSLSTYWKEIYKDSLPDFPNRISLVDVKPPETKEGPAEVVETIVPDISELDYLRQLVIPKYAMIRCFWSVSSMILLHLLYYLLTITQKDPFFFILV